MTITGSLHVPGRVDSPWLLVIEIKLSSEVSLPGTPSYHPLIQGVGPLDCLARGFSGQASESSLPITADCFSLEQSCAADVLF